MAGNELTGIDTTFRTPGNRAEIVFAQGPASAAAGQREVVLVMPKTSSGTWAANSLEKIQNEQDAINGAGAGSPLHRAARKFLRMNKDAKLWAVPYDATSGGTPVEATAVLTLANAATGTGTLSVTVSGELCQFTFDSGASVTEIGDGIAASINAKKHLPCTASNSSGVVTLTAKVAGTSQGTATLGVIRVRAKITAGIATTASFGGAFLGSGAAGAEGTTTEAVNLTTALAALDSLRKYYIVVSVNSAAQLAILKTHIATKSEPKRGLRSFGIWGYPGGLTTCQTLSIGLNYERTSVAWQLNSEHDSAELAAALAAVRQKREQTDVSHNFNGESLSGHILPAYDTADWPDDDDYNDAIIDGITPISSSDTGTTIVHSVTNRSKDSAGTLNDPRASRTVKVSTPDSFVDDVLVRFGLRYGQKKSKPDERLANGSVNPNQKVIRNVVRPSMIESVLVETLDEYEDEHLQDVATTKESISVNQATGNAGRAAAGMELHTVDWLDQIHLRVSEVSEG